MKMRMIVTLALAGALPLCAGGTAAAADIPGNSSTKATLPQQPTYTTGSLERWGDHDWYRVTLQKGADYAFNAEDLPFLALRTADGKLLASISGGYPTGFHYRPEVTGTYFVDAGDNPYDEESHSSVPYRIRLTSDCRPNSTTTCSLTLGKKQQRLATYSYDNDWYRVTLDKKKSYSMSLYNYEGAYPILGIVDGSGNRLTDFVGVEAKKSGSIRNFRPPSSGTYYIAVTGGDGLYDVSYKYETDTSLPPSLGRFSNP